MNVWSFFFFKKKKPPKLIPNINYASGGEVIFFFHSELSVNQFLWVTLRSGMMKEGEKIAPFLLRAQFYKALWCNLPHPWLFFLWLKCPQSFSYSSWGKRTIAHVLHAVNSRFSLRLGKNLHLRRPLRIATTNEVNSHLHSQMIKLSRRYLHTWMEYRAYWNLKKNQPCCIDHHIGKRVWSTSLWRFSYILASLTKRMV